MQATLKKDDERMVLFRFDHLWGWIFVLLGPAWLLLWPSVTDAKGRWFLVGFAALFLLMGVLTALRRCEVRLDLVERTWWRRVGFWPQVEEASGSLDEVSHVEVGSSMATRDGGGASVSFRVELVFDSPQWSEKLRYSKTSNAAAAMVQAHRVADRLGVPVQD